MKTKGNIYLICTSADDRGHHAVAAQPSDPARTVHRGEGKTREEALAKALHCTRIFYADPEVERDVLVAEARERPVLWRVHDHTIERLPEAA